MKLNVFDPPGRMSSSPDPKVCGVCGKPALYRLGSLGRCRAHRADVPADVALKMADRDARGQQAIQRSIGDDHCGVAWDGLGYKGVTS